MSGAPRRGSQAVEFALAVPVLLTLFSGVVDVSESLMVHDALVAAVGEASRGGSVVDPAAGDREATALSTATQAWSATERAETPQFTAVIQGAAPDRMLVVTGTVTVQPLIGLVPLPNTLSWSARTRLTVQAP